MLFAPLPLFHPGVKRIAHLSYGELPGAQHSFDLLSSIRLEAVIDGIEAFVGSVAVPDPTPASTRLKWHGSSRLRIPR